MKIDYFAYFYVFINMILVSIFLYHNRNKRIKYVCIPN